MAYASLDIRASVTLCNTCLPPVGSVGCAFVNADGFCYQAPGQVFCADHPQHAKCFSAKVSTLLGTHAVLSDHTAAMHGSEDPRVDYSSALWGANTTFQALPLGMNSPRRRKKGGATPAAENAMPAQVEPPATSAGGEPSSTSAGVREVEPKYLQSAQCKAPAAEDPLQLNFNCIRYTSTQSYTYLGYCKEEDCRQARSSVGCTFMNQQGFCYTKKGQEWCASMVKSADTKARACITRPDSPPPYLSTRKCKPKEKEDPLTLNFNCERYSSTRRQRYLSTCQAEDCAQARGETGCKYMNEAGFCYVAAGQAFCKANPGDSRCVTSPSVPEPYKQHGECKERDPFSLNQYCTIYQGRKKERYLRRCQRQDCVQARAQNCKYLNAQGFCWSPTGQKACEANPSDERCLTSLPNSIEPAYKQSFSCAVRKEAEKDPLQVNYYCRKYERRKYGRWLRICADEDCAQARSSLGCKYMNEKGYCYVESGQNFCSKSPDDKRCLTTLPPSVVPAALKSSRCSTGDPLELNTNCVRYIERKKTRYLRRCERQDCTQARSQVGCKYMNADGFCYTKPGQEYCATQKDNERCHTEIGSLPPYLRNGDCRQQAVPLTINRSCQRYTYRKRWRYRRECGREDCMQIKSIGCKYMNKDGFCYRLSGQQFCAANPKDQRCLTNVPNKFHNRCAAMRGAPLPPLPAPSSMGLRPGFQGRFYYMRKHMDRAPNLSSRKPNAIRISETIDYSSLDDFQVVAPDFPQDYFAGVWQGVFQVERAGQYTFSSISEDGSHVWVDSYMVVDNGGMHAAQKVSNSVRLGRGYHSLRADFFKNAGGAMVVVQWKGPDTLDRVEALNGFHFEGGAPEALPEGRGRQVRYISIYLSIYVCVCIYTYIIIYMHACMHACEHKYIHACTYI